MMIRKLDAAIILIFFLIAAVFYGFSRWGNDSNYHEKYVVIYSDNKLYKKITVSDDKLTETIQINNKDGQNTVKIIDGGVVMEESDCPDKTCTKTGFIDRPGQSIVCLPHKLVIEITGSRNGEEESGIDAVAR